MKYYIGFSPHSLPSAKLLKQALIESVIGADKFILSNKYKGNCLISYGNINSIGSKHNNPSFIRACSNKLIFSRIMEKYGIASPIYRTGKPTEFPCIVRATLIGCGGVGISVFENENSYNDSGLNTNYYWTKFVATSNEYRIHVLGGNIVKIFVKKFTGEKEEALPIRNLKNGYHFSLVEKTYEKLAEVVKSIEAAFRTEGLEPSYYALDGGYVRGNGWFIFEANSAPGLNEYTVKLYAQYLAAALKLKEESKDDILRATENTGGIKIPTT